MAAQIKIDQDGLSAGVADRSRSDGLDDGSEVTLTSVVPGTTNTWKLLWVPIGDTDAVSTLVASGTTTTFTPSSDVYGTYRILLTVDEGLATQSYSIRTFSIRTPVAGLRTPALNERASYTASLDDDGADQVDASETNEDEVSGPFASGNYGGWYAALAELFDAVESIANGVTRVLTGVTPLTVGTITDGQFVKREGTSLISAAVDTTPSDGSITIAKTDELLSIVTSAYATGATSNVTIDILPSGRAAATLTTGIYEIEILVILAYVGSTGTHGLTFTAGGGLTISTCRLDINAQSASSTASGTNHYRTSYRSSSLPSALSVCASGGTYDRVTRVRGRINVTAGGTLTCRVNFPGSVNQTIEPGSFVRLRRVGSTSFVSQGAWS